MRLKKLFLLIALVVSILGLGFYSSSKIKVFGDDAVSVPDSIDGWNVLFDYGPIRIDQTLFDDNYVDAYFSNHMYYKHPTGYTIYYHDLLYNLNDWNTFIFVTSNYYHLTENELLSIIASSLGPDILFLSNGNYVNYSIPLNSFHTCEVWYDYFGAKKATFSIIHDSANSFTCNYVINTSVSNSNYNNTMYFLNSIVPSILFGYFSVCNNQTVYAEGFDAGTKSKSDVSLYYSTVWKNYYYEEITNIIKRNYTLTSDFNDVVSSKDAEIASLTSQLNTNPTVSFGQLLKQIIDYPIDFVKSVFTHEVTSTTNGVTTTTMQPYSLFGIEVSSFILGIFAISLTFALIGIVKKFWR